MEVQQPIVTVLGHVDHGKTTLLDYIRKTNVVAREAGGITQHIGAYEVETPHGAITFIDTPGHETFSAMRARGATAADIAILVVAANEGVKPQTREALQKIQQANLPFIVAATKIDLPSADIEIVKAQIEKEGILLEGRGGDVPVVAVSAKTGEGINHLLEIISLLAQVNEIKGNKDDELMGMVIESKHDSHKGPLATIVVRAGTIKVGDVIYAENTQAKVRSMTDALGKIVKELSPGKAAEILGFAAVPTVGSYIASQIGKAAELQSQIKQKADKDELQLIVKADTAGTLEALLASLDPRVAVLSAGIGEVNQNDVMLASSFKVPVLAYSVRVPAESKKLAEEEAVLIKQFSIIYEAIAWVTEVISGKEKPIVETILGKAEVVAEFPYGERERIAGVRVKEGRIAKSDTIRIMRGNDTIIETKIESLKQQARMVDVVQKNQECGIIFAQKVDFRPGDMVLSVKI